MKITIDIPDEFINDYITDKFKDFFSRVAADIDNDGLCGNYEKETAEMFLKAFEESGRKTNADMIRNMSDVELAEFLDVIEEDGISSQCTNLPCDCCRDKECSNCWKNWLQSEAE